MRILILVFLFILCIESKLIKERIYKVSYVNDTDWNLKQQQVGIKTITNKYCYYLHLFCNDNNKRLRK